MSFIAVTYGYNMFSVFNIDCSTFPLVDEIKETCFKNIKETLPEKLSTLMKELNNTKDQVEKTLKDLEICKSKKKDEEEKIKITELENNKKVSDIKKDKKNITTNKGKLTNTNIEENALLNKINDDIVNNTNSLEYQNKCKEKYESKIPQLEEKVYYFKNLDFSKLTIDLIDGSGNRVEINSKDNAPANSYLMEKQCYELVIKNISKDIYIYIILIYLLKDNKNEITYDPIKIDGFILRTIHEDLKFEDSEKNKVVNNKKINTTNTAKKK